MTDPEAEPAAVVNFQRPRRLRLVLSVRTMMVLVLIVGGWLGWRVRRAEIQKRAVARVEKVHGDVYYEYPYPGGFRNSRDEPWAPDWVRKAVGDAYFQEVKSVSFYNFDTKTTGNTFTITTLPDSEAVTDAQLAPIVAFDRLEGVIIHSERITDAALATLGRISSLRSIQFGDAPITDAGLAHLRPLKHLRKLELQQNQIGFHLIDSPEERKVRKQLMAEVDAGQLKAGREFNDQEYLRLHKHFTDAGLANLSGMAELEELALKAKGVSDAGLAHLAGLTNLRSLNLNSAAIKGTGLVHLKRMKNLRELDLSSTGVDDASLGHLAGLTQLRTLNLGNTEITDAGLDHLKGLNHLEDLSLVVNRRLTDAGLARLKGLTTLEHLNLGMTGVTGAGLVHLSGLSALKSLHLPGNGTIHDADLVHLKGLTALETLDLDGNPITDAGLAHLRGLSRLKRLSLNRTKVSDEGVATLSAAIPKVQIEHDTRSTLGPIIDKLGLPEPPAELPLMEYEPAAVPSAK